MQIAVRQGRGICKREARERLHFLNTYLSR